MASTGSERSSPPPPRDNIAKSAGRAGAATLTSRILGVVREQVLAAFFGASHEMDAFVVAFRIPNLLRDLLAEGAMSAAFVPTFTRELTRRGREEAWRLGNSVLTGLMLITGTIVAVAMLFAGPLVHAFAGEFAEVPGKFELTVLLTRVMLPFLTLAAVAAVVMGMLNSLHHYFVPALAPATFNVATIVSIGLLGPLMPMLGLPPIMSVAIAALLGGASQIAIQWPILRREGFRFTPRLQLRDPAFRQVLLMMGPGTLGLAATQINLLLTTIIASRQGPGAVSWLQYAFRVMYLPIGLFGVSIATAVLPAVSRHAAEDDVAAIRRTVAHGIRLMLVVNLPATIGLLLMAPQTVRLLFERGRFLPADTAATALAVQCYALGLVGYSAARIVSPVFYALGRSRTAVIVSTASVTLNIALSLALVRFVGFSGLALATALSAIFNGALSMYLLRRQLSGIEGGLMASTAVKVAAACAVMAVAVQATGVLAGRVWPGDGLGAQVVQLATPIAAGLGVLLLCVPLFGIREAEEVLARVAGRIGLRGGGRHGSA